MNKFTEIKPKRARSKQLNAFSLAGIGIGGIIGAGFFLGSGLAINQAGPAIILAFMLGGIIMSQVLGAMTSISINRPVRGSFRVYAEEFLGPYIGFLVGWMVFTSGILSISSEAIAGGIFLRYWFPHTPMAVFALLILIVITGINALGTKLMGYIESSMSVVKTLLLVLFIILGGVFLFNHGISVSPNPYISINNFFPNGISGVLQSMLVVIFTFAGVSAVAMATSEVNNPRVEIPKATIYMTLGIVVLYFLSMIIITSIISWQAVSTSISPFVQTFNRMGIGFASSVMNAVILIATISVMVASFYSCLQLLISLSESNKAPEIFKVATGKGFYKNAWLVVSICSLIIVLLSFVLGSKLFHYLISASSYSTFLNWFINLLTYLVWLKHRSEAEKFSSPLIWGRAGAYSILVAIIALFIFSLRVPDFRMGFYVALAAIFIISVVYRMLITGLRPVINNN